MYTSVTKLKITDQNLNINLSYLGMKKKLIAATSSINLKKPKFLNAEVVGSIEIIVLNIK